MGSSIDVMRLLPASRVYVMVRLSDGTLSATVSVRQYPLLYVVRRTVPSGSVTVVLVLRPPLIVYVKVYVLTPSAKVSRWTVPFPFTGSPR